MYLVNESLMLASIAGHLDVARVLLENGALVDAKDLIEEGKLVYKSIK